jgi:hypothetical protein
MQGTSGAQEARRTEALSLQPRRQDALLVAPHRVDLDRLFGRRLGDVGLLFGGGVRGLE